MVLLAFLLKNVHCSVSEVFWNHGDPQVMMESLWNFGSCLKCSHSGDGSAHRMLTQIVLSGKSVNQQVFIKLKLVPDTVFQAKH